MRINWDTQVEELFHSYNIAYVDLDANEICHFKYIKREKLSNGKWRYYYDQSELDQYKMIADRANKNAAKTANKLNIAQNAEEIARRERKDARTKASTSRKRRDRVAFTKRAMEYDSQVKTARKNRIEAETYHKNATKTARKATRAYELKKVSTFAARTVSKGAVKVANFLSSSAR